MLDEKGNALKPARAGRHVTDHTIAKELVALRAALKLAKRRGIWKGDPAEVLPVGFAPEYKPRNRFLTYDELEALLGELLEDAAARVAFTIATSAEAAATERALREDVSPDRLFVQVRGSKRATRWRKVPIVANWQRELLDFALEHARGRDGRLFLPRTKFGHAGARLRARRHPALHAERSAPYLLHLAARRWCPQRAQHADHGAQGHAYARSRLRETTAGAASRPAARGPRKVQCRCSKHQRRRCTERTHRTASRRPNR